MGSSKASPPTPAFVTGKHKAKLTRVGAVIVTFNPEIAQLRTLVASLSHQVLQITVVDNTPHDHGDAPPRISAAVSSEFENVQVIHLGSNQGVAAAQNVGIRASLENQCNYILLSDQDSLPADDMVAVLVDSICKLESDGEKVGAVGPVFSNSVVSRPFRFDVFAPNLLGFRRKRNRVHEDYLCVRSLISSGCLIPTSVIQVVGIMADDFFVDFIDIEWCMRATSFGYGLYAINGAKMTHEMGDASMRVWLFGWKTISEYRPARLYYQFRNSAYLIRLSYVPFIYKVRLVKFWLAKLYAYELFSPNKIACLKMMYRGFIDGIRGRLGSRDCKKLCV